MLGVAPWEEEAFRGLEVAQGLVEVAACPRLGLLPQESCRCFGERRALLGGDPPAVVEAICLEDDDFERLLCSRLVAASWMVSSLVLSVLVVVVVVIVISSVMESRLQR